MSGLHLAVAEINSLEQLAEQKTCIHALHPAVKLVTAFAYIFAVVSFGRYEISALVPFAFYPAVLMALSETPYRLLLRRLLLVLPFPVLAAAPNLLLDRTVLAAAGGIRITGGELSFVSVLLKTVFSVTAVLLLIATTSMPDLSAVLIRLRVPAAFVLQITMTYRYIAVLAGEASSMVTAYLLRSPRRKGIRWTDMGAFLGQLILRSYARAHRVYAAMKCRGFDGYYRGGGTQRLDLPSVFYCLLVLSALVVLRFVNLSRLAGDLFL